MAELGRDGNLAPEQHSRRMRWLQENALVQHAVPVARLVREVNPAVIYCLTRIDCWRCAIAPRSSLAMI